MAIKPKSQIEEQNTRFLLGNLVFVYYRGFARIEQRNKFCKGDVIEIMKPDGRNIPVTVNAIYDAEGNEVESAPHPQQVLYLDLSEKPQQYDLLRVENIKNSEIVLQ